MTVSQVWFVLVAILSPLHEFPVGHVERTISVIVDDEAVFVEYGIGLSDETAVNLIEQKKLNEATDLMATTQSAADPATGPPAASVLDLASNFPDSSSELREVSDANDQVLPAEDTPKNREDKTSRLLTAALEPQIPQQLELQINGERVPLELIDAAPSPRHHINLLMRMKAELPAGGRLQISLIDHNFVGNPDLGPQGNVRTALRVRGKTAILSSDVARVMARAVPMASADFPSNPDSSISIIKAEILVTKPEP